MKKMILIVAFTLSTLQASSLKYVDLYGEIQVNAVVAEKCLEEVAYTRSTSAQQCTNKYRCI